MGGNTSARSAGVRWGAAAMAGVTGGAIFLLLQMLMVPVFLGASAWTWLRMTAAIVLGQEVLLPEPTLDGGVLLTGALLHLVITAGYGLLLGVLANSMAMETAIITGAVFGLALYFVVYYVLAPIFPWFAQARNWVSVFAHIVFGMATGWVLARGLTRRPARSRF